MEEVVGEQDRAHTGAFPPARLPNDEAQAITGRSHLSYSQVSFMRALPQEFVQVVHNFDFPAHGSRLAAVKHSIAPIWDAIEAGNYYPVPFAQNCTTGPFRSRCPAFAR